jgi:GNAT superfamily N-acetyltransferase
VQSGFTVPQFRRRGVAKALHAKVEEIARERSIKYVWCNLFFNQGPDPVVLKQVGYTQQTIINFQDTKDFMVKHQMTTQRYADKWAGWSSRPAKASDVDWIVRGIKDIYEVEQRPPREDMSPEVEITKDLIANDEIIVAVDAEQKPLGYLAFTNAEEFPYGSGFYGKWFQKYIWALYVWVDSNQRGSGVASYLYGKLFERSSTLGMEEIGLDVFNVNTTSQKFHQQGVGFHPEVRSIHHSLPIHPDLTYPTGSGLHENVGEK